MMDAVAPALAALIASRIPLSVLLVESMVIAAGVPEPIVIFNVPVPTTSVVEVNVLELRVCAFAMSVTKTTYEPAVAVSLEVADTKDEEEEVVLVA